MYRVLLMFAIFFIVIVFVFPVVFEPGVETPPTQPFGNSLSLTLRLSNQNVTPLLNVEYTCQATQLVLANGRQIEDAAVVNRGSIRRLQGRKAIAVPCEAAYIITDPIKSAVYKLALHYRPYPWPQTRTSEYYFGAVVDAAGHVTGWKQK
jgi:hypothetical protein